jgi:hypothetical protein
MVALYLDGTDAACSAVIASVNVPSISSSPSGRILKFFSSMLTAKSSPFRTKVISVVVSAIVVWSDGKLSDGISVLRFVIRSDFQSQTVAVPDVNG